MMTTCTKILTTHLDWSVRKITFPAAELFRCLEDSCGHQEVNKCILRTNFPAL